MEEKMFSQLVESVESFAERKRGFRCMPVEQLRAMLSYDPQTGVLTWLVRANPSLPVGSTAGALSGDGYYYVTWSGWRYRAHRIAWALHHGEWPNDEIDHVNGVKTDNRIANLRIVSAAQNQMNRGISRANTSGFKGVTWHKRYGKFTAAIRVNGKKKHLGYFLTAAEAGAAYARAAQATHGQYLHRESAAALAGGAG